MGYTLTPQQVLATSEGASNAVWEFSSTTRPPTRKRPREACGEPLDELLPHSCVLTHVALYIVGGESGGAVTVSESEGVTWWLAQDKLGERPLTARQTSSFNPTIASPARTGGVADKLDDIQWEAEPENRSLFLHAFSSSWTPETAAVALAKLTWRRMPSGLYGCDCGG